MKTDNNNRKEDRKVGNKRLKEKVMILICTHSKKEKSRS